MNVEFSEESCSGGDFRVHVRTTVLLRLTALSTYLVPLVILTVSLLPLSSVLAEGTKELRVGAVLSLTGMASAHGSAILDGLQFRKHELEEQGWKISLVVEDDGSEAKRTVTAVERLSAQGIQFFVGPTWGILAIPAAPVIARTKSLSLQPCNSSDFVTGVNDRYFFLFTPPSRSEELLTDFLKHLPATKVAIIVNSSSWGDLWAKIFRNAATRAGKSIQLEEFIQFSENDQSIPALMPRLKRSGAEVLLSTTTKEAVALTIRELSRNRMRMTFVSPDLIDARTEELTPETDPFVEGYSVTPVVNREFGERFRAWKGSNPRKYTDSGADALTALSEAIRNVGTDVEKVREYFLTKLDVPGAAGRIRFNAERDVAGSGYEIPKVVERNARTP